MAKPAKKQAKQNKSPTSASPKSGLWLGLGIVAVAAVGVIIAAVQNSGKTPANSPKPSTTVTATATATSRVASSGVYSPTNPAPPPVMEINQAVMVTVELDFGNQVPTIAEALKQIERRYQPADGVGRTFAILDAYGQATPGGKLHISMHVSTEKPGVGSLVFRRTGEVLWSSRINPSTNTNAQTFTGKNLLVLVDNGQGKLWTIDGSSNPLSVLDANLKELGAPLRSVWEDGVEREITFIYSACGCPVKVMTKRVGDSTVRAKDMPVIFPDDPAVVEVITRLMRW